MKVVKIEIVSNEFSGSDFFKCFVWPGQTSVVEISEDLLSNSNNVLLQWREVVVQVQPSYITSPHKLLDTPDVFYRI